MERAATPGARRLFARDVDALEFLDGGTARGQPRGRIGRGRLLLQLLFER
ncbi:MAG TPA: hypothetical protein VFL16_06475 [Steroidobacteraceae bacterium]|nr:hypothetical protein [Steroidobacteraceae bacterium]